jgi:hypothetical protein
MREDAVAHPCVDQKSLVGVLVQDVGQGIGVKGVEVPPVG